MEPVATRIPVDDALVERFLPGASYADSFTATADGSPPAREWARLTLAGGSEIVRKGFGRAVWGGALGFDLVPDTTPNTFLGWHITDDEPTLFAVETDGHLMAGRMIFVTDGPTVTWTTTVKYHSDRARRTWAVLQHAHRQIAPRVLNGARRALLRSTHA